MCRGADDIMSPATGCDIVLGKQCYYLFFARYYLGKEDPVASAIADRDFLADSYRKHGKNDEGVKLVEGLHQSIVNIIQTSLEHTAESL